MVQVMNSVAYLCHHSCPCSQPSSHDTLVGSFSTKPLTEVSALDGLPQLRQSRNIAVHVCMFVRVCKCTCTIPDSQDQASCNKLSWWTEPNFGVITVYWHHTMEHLKQNHSNLYTFYTISYCC